MSLPLVIPTVLLRTQTFLLGFAAIKMISMNINNILRDPANTKNNLCETIFEYLFWLSEK